MRGGEKFVLSNNEPREAHVAKASTQIRRCQEPPGLVETTLALPPNLARLIGQSPGPTKSGSLRFSGGTEWRREHTAGSVLNDHSSARSDRCGTGGASPAARREVHETERSWKRVSIIAICLIETGITIGSTTN